MNELDSKAHSRAIDALLNYETVKYFNNEDFEARRYDEGLDATAAPRSSRKSTLSLLQRGPGSSSLRRAWWRCSGAPLPAWSSTA